MKGRRWMDVLFNVAYREIDQTNIKADITTNQKSGKWRGGGRSLRQIVFKGKTTMYVL